MTDNALPPTDDETPDEINEQPPQAEPGADNGQDDQADDLSPRLERLGGEPAPDITPEEFARLQQAGQIHIDPRGRVRTTQRDESSPGISLRKRRAWYVMIAVQLEHVRAALALENFDVLAAQRRMAPQPRALRRSRNRPGQPRQAGVLILLYPAVDGLSFALIRRTQNPRDVHSGQISLPGGSQEAGETPVETALREAKEELGFNEPVQILGSLACLYIPPSDFEVRPTVGYMDHRPEWTPDQSEVVEVLECPLVVAVGRYAQGY